MQTIGILGLGIIGTGIAKHIEQLGHSVIVWNRTPQSGWNHYAHTPGDVAQQSKIIALYLKDRNACLEVFNQLRPALTPEHTIINHSTIDLATCMKLAQECQAIGCTYVDAPFTGSKNPAAQGQLVYYVGTDETTLARIKPILELSSKAIVPTGPIGSATVLKLVTNMISASMVQVLSEALAITNAYGMDADLLLEAMENNVVISPLAKFKLPFMQEKDFGTHFSLDNMRKDGTYALELAADKGIIPPSCQLVSSIMTRLCAEGKADLDFSCLASQFEEQNKSL